MTTCLGQVLAARLGQRVRQCRNRILAVRIDDFVQRGGQSCLDTSPVARDPRVLHIGHAGNYLVVTTGERSRARHARAFVRSSSTRRARITAGPRLDRKDTPTHARASEHAHDSAFQELDQIR